MQRNKVILWLICLNLIFPILVFGAEQKEWKPLNANQPISIGERIYSGQNSKDKVANGIVYSYDGSDGNSIKIKIERTIVSLNFFKNEPPESITLPLNAKKQALLKVETLDDTEPNREILITVVDDFYRITAEEYKKNGK